MPLLEYWKHRPVPTRFTFNRTLGPNKGLKSIGTYYLKSTLPKCTVAESMDLGLYGYLSVEPGGYGFAWQPLARSVPAPLLIGTTDPNVLRIKGLVYFGRNTAEVEDFLRGAKAAIGPYPGTIDVYNADGIVAMKRYTDCYFRGITHNYDGAKNFVEYDLEFATNRESSTLNTIASCNDIGTLSGSFVDGIPEGGGGSGVDTISKMSLMNKDENPASCTVGSGNDLDTSLTLGETPIANSFVWVTVNGVIYTVGNNDTTKAFYIGDTVGVSKDFASLIATDKLFYNAAIAGRDLLSTDLVSIYYAISVVVP